MNLGAVGQSEGVAEVASALEMEEQGQGLMADGQNPLPKIGFDLVGRRALLSGPVNGRDEVFDQRSEGAGLVGLNVVCDHRRRASWPGEHGSSLPMLSSGRPVSSSQK